MYIYNIFQTAFFKTVLRIMRLEWLIKNAIWSSILVTSTLEFIFCLLTYSTFNKEALF